MLDPGSGSGLVENHVSCRLPFHEYGKHLLIQVKRDDSLDTVARLTESSRNRYTSAFRTHSGRWEPLPAAGNMRQTTEAVVSMLASYLDPEM